MRLIQQDRHNPQQLAVSWMWLPTFIGQNSQLLGELDHVLSAKFPPPFELTDDKLDEIHRFVVDWICTKIRIPGLWHYLRAIEDVGDDVPAVQKNLFRELRQAVSGLDMENVKSIGVSGKVTDETDLEQGPITLDVAHENYDGPETDKRILLSKRMLGLLGQDRLADLVENGQIQKHHNPLTSEDLFYLPIEEEADEPVPG